MALNQDVTEATPLDPEQLIRDLLMFLGVAGPVWWLLHAYVPLPLKPDAANSVVMLCGLASLYAGIEAVFHRREWFGRRWRPRWWAWSVAVFLIVAGCAALLVHHAVPLFKTIDALHPLLQSAHGDQLIAAQTQSEEALFSLYLDAIGLLFALSLIAVTRPANYTDFSLFQAALFCLAGFLGRAPAGFLFDYLRETGHAPTLGERLLIGPLTMMICGVFVLAALIAILGLCAALIVFVFVTLPLKLFDLIEARNQAAQINAQKKAGLAAYLNRFDAWLRADPLPYVPDESRGARFATPQEILHTRKTTGFAFGHVNGFPLLLETEKHVLVMASTRSGKGVTLIIPHLLRHKGSAFVLDPKGENARATGPYRERLNGAVHYLDPFGISGKPLSRFNPLAGLTEETMEAGSKALAGALVMNEKRDHWTASGQQLVAALILHVLTSATYPPEMKDLVTVRRLLLGAITPALEEMRTNEAADGLVADLAASFLATPEKEFGSIVSTAQRETEILDNPYIAACLAAAGDEPEVDFGAWHIGTMTVYLCLSAPKFPVFNRWLRLVLTSALDAMTDQLNPPAEPVCFMLDELATLGHLGAIENAVGLSAGYGIQLVTVFQDIAQMKDLYKGRWASFIGNAGVRALFNLDDYDTAKYWSDFLGGQLVGTRGETQDIYGLTKGQTAGEALRPLLSPEQIMLRYAADRMLVLQQGLRPIESERVPYWLDRWLEGRWRDPRVSPIAQAAAWPQAAE